MSIRSTGRCRRSSGNGLSAILIACMTLIFALSGCAASGSDGSPPPAVGQQTNEPAAVAGTDPASITDPRPVRIAIPAIGVDSDLMKLGLESNGALQVPPGGFPAGWYSGSPVPGELGPAVIAGHVDWGGKPGVFFRLHELAPGDEITTDRSDGITEVFRVASVERYAKDAFPTAKVYGDIDHPGLRLITCGGEFDTAARSYRDNTVVFADLVGMREPNAN
ncbi:sortase (surface protein transpeptidase) [Rhodococcus sp. LBL1]|nr:sortase (surface protein transpeptidase) [Rhodococcus sp. LBL1]MDH6681325.1 sortase (surface protein transpeptidase) [Rhodococcus sp. LBL2]